MTDIPFPPNLKKSKKGQTIRYFVCPQCGHIFTLSFVVDLEVFDHGRNAYRYGRYDDPNCFKIHCYHCNTTFRLMSPRADCKGCPRTIDCLLNGHAISLTRRMFKPYSLINPKRITYWE